MNRQKSGRFRRLLILIAILGLIFVGLAAFRAGPAPQVTVEVELPGIGKRTPIRVVVTEPTRGLSGVRIEFVQGERVQSLDSRGYTPLEPWSYWGERTEQDEFVLDVGSETLEQIEEGPAIIRDLMTAPSDVRHIRSLLDVLARGAKSPPVRAARAVSPLLRHRDEGVRADAARVVRAWQAADPEMATLPLLLEAVERMAQEDRSELVRTFARPN